MAILSKPRSTVCWPCRLDEDHAKTVSELTVKRYEGELSDFVEWLLKGEHNPISASQIDALVVCYKIGGLLDTMMFARSHFKDFSPVTAC